MPVTMCCLGGDVARSREYEVQDSLCALDTLRERIGSWSMVVDGEGGIRIEVLISLDKYNRSAITYR